MTDQGVQAALSAANAGRPAEALERLRALGAAAAHDPVALQLWAVLLKDEASRADALALTERAVRIAPRDSQAHFNLAVTLQSFDRLDEALLHYQQALSIDPGHLGALNNASDLQRRRGRPEEGWALMERYQAVGGDVAGLEIRLAKLALDTHRFEASERWFQAAGARAPDDASVAFEHAMLTLAREDWPAGWARYERRLALHGWMGLGMYPHAQPAWRGDALEGRTLLLHREQGLGDMIMFASALPELLETPGVVHLAIHPGLVRLFQSSFPKARVWSSVTAAGRNDQPEQPWLKVTGPIHLQAPVCSLGALRMNGGPPTPRAYLKPPAEEVERWRGLMEALAPKRAGRRRIGLVIGARRPLFSEEGMINHRRKSIPPSMIGALAEAVEADWFALHDRESRAMLADVPRLSFVDLAPWITDLADTAAAIANLDLVITVDTAVAHLAGALGKPVWILLWRNADWRWGIGRETAVWYPDARLFRQKRAEDWAGVIDEVAADLAASD